MERLGFAFAAPPDWVSQTIVSLRAPQGPGAKNAPNVVITEEPMRDGETLQTCSSRQLAELAQQLPQFDVLETSETTLGGLPAMLLRFVWVSHLGGIEQSMFLVERTGRVVFSLTSTASVEDAEQTRSIFADFVRSVRFDAQETRTVSDVAPRPSPAPQSGTLRIPDVPMPGARRTSIKERT